MTLAELVTQLTHLNVSSCLLGIERRKLGVEGGYLGIKLSLEQ